MIPAAARRPLNVLISWKTIAGGYHLWKWIWILANYKVYWLSLGNAAGVHGGGRRQPSCMITFASITADSTKYFGVFRPRNWAAFASFMAVYIINCLSGFR